MLYSPPKPSDQTLFFHIGHVAAFNHALDKIHTEHHLIIEQHFKKFDLSEPENFFVALERLFKTDNLDPILKIIGPVLELNASASPEKQTINGATEAFTKAYLKYVCPEINSINDLCEKLLLKPETGTLILDVNGTLVPQSSFLNSQNTRLLEPNLPNTLEALVKKGWHIKFITPFKTTLLSPELQAIIDKAPEQCAKKPIFGQYKGNFIKQILAQRRRVVFVDNHYNELLSAIDCAPNDADMLTPFFMVKNYPIPSYAKHTARKYGRKVHPTDDILVIDTIKMLARQEYDFLTEEKMIFAIRFILRSDIISQILSKLTQENESLKNLLQSLLSQIQNDQLNPDYINLLMDNILNPRTALAILKALDYTLPEQENNSQGLIWGTNIPAENLSAKVLKNTPAIRECKKFLSDNTRNILYLSGEAGVGKTQAAVEAMKAAKDQNNKALFLGYSGDTVSNWIQENLYGDIKYMKWFLKHYNFSVIVADDVNMLTGINIEVLIEILKYAQENKTCKLILTSNIALNNLGSNLDTIYQIELNRIILAQNPIPVDLETESLRQNVSTYGTMNFTPTVTNPNNYILPLSGFSAIPMEEVSTFFNNPDNALIKEFLEFNAPLKGLFLNHKNSYNTLINIVSYFANHGLKVAAIDGNHRYIMNALSYWSKDHYLDIDNDRRIFQDYKNPQVIIITNVEAILSKAGMTAALETFLSERHNTNEGIIILTSNNTYLRFLNNLAPIISFVEATKERNARLRSRVEFIFTHKQN